MPTPSGFASRPFSGRDDLRAIGALMSATWNGPRRPLVPGTSGRRGPTHAADIVAPIARRSERPAKAREVMSAIGDIRAG